MVEKSEFGRGFTLCLLKFIEHEGQHRWWEDPTLSGISGESSNVQMWFNGSSDHFYDLIGPKVWKPQPTFVKDAFKLRERALDMGHGKGLMTSRTAGFTSKEVDNCLEIARNVLRGLDRKTGATLFQHLAQSVSTFGQDNSRPHTAVGSDKSDLLFLPKDWLEISTGRKYKPAITSNDSQVVQLMRELKSLNDPLQKNQKIFSFAVSMDKRLGIKTADSGQW